CFDERLRSLEATFSEYRQTNPFVDATDRLQDSLQRENDEFLRNIDENMKKIIKGQVKSQVKDQVSQEQRNLYKALVKAYDVDKAILDTNRESTILKRRREDDDQEGPSAGSDRGSKRRKEGEEPVQTTCQMEETLLPVYETGVDDQPTVQTSQHPEWFSQPRKPPSPD
nr:hypothetical protein [Tanacetum cinerariifolium]